MITRFKPEPWPYPIKTGQFCVVDAKGLGRCNLSRIFLGRAKKRKRINKKRIFHKFSRFRENQRQRVKISQKFALSFLPRIKP